MAGGGRVRVAAARRRVPGCCGEGQGEAGRLELVAEEALLTKLLGVLAQLLQALPQRLWVDVLLACTPAFSRRCELLEHDFWKLDRQNNICSIRRCAMTQHCSTHPAMCKLAHCVEGRVERVQWRRLRQASTASRYSSGAAQVRTVGQRPVPLAEALRRGSGEAGLVLLSVTCAKHGTT